MFRPLRPLAGFWCTVAFGLLSGQVTADDKLDLTSIDGQITLHLPSEWKAFTPTTVPATKVQQDFHARNASTHEVMNGHVARRGADPKVAMAAQRTSSTARPDVREPSELGDVTIKGNRVVYFDVQRTVRGNAYRELFTLTETPTCWTWLFLSVPADQYAAEKPGLLSIATTATEQAAAKVTLKSADGRFQVTVPGGWHDVTSRHPGFTLMAANEVVMEGVSVRVTAIKPKEKVDIKKTIENSAKVVSGQLTNAKISTPEAVQLNGNWAMQCTITGTMPTKHEVGYLLTVIQTNDEGMFVIGYSPLAMFNDRLKDLRAVARDFKENPR